MIYKSGQNQKGVDPTPLTPGYGFRKLFTEDVKEYPVYQQTVVWTKAVTEGSTIDESITANSKEGLAINLDTSLSYTLEQSKVPDLYVKFHTDIVSIQETYIRNAVRSAIQEVFGEYSNEEIYGPKKQEISDKIKGVLVKNLSSDGFTITQFTINEVRMPTAIIDAINSKMAASQRAGQAEQELRVIKVQAEQAVAKAKGEADARVAQATAEAEAIKISASAIQSQGGADYVKLKWIEAWAAGGAKVPQIVSGANGGNNFLLQLDGLSK